MVPQRITLVKNLSQSQVLDRIATRTDPTHFSWYDFRHFWRIKYKKGALLAGWVDHGAGTFCLHDHMADAGLVHLVYHGSVENQGDTCTIRVWVRPSATYQLAYAIMILLALILTWKVTLWDARLPWALAAGAAFFWIAIGAASYRYRQTTRRLFRNILAKRRRQPRQIS